MRKLRFPPKLRDVLAANNAADRFYAAMNGKEPVAQTPIPLKRRYTQNEQRVSEADVLQTIREFSSTRDDIVLWRNVSGSAMTNAGPIRFGVGPNGASDFIGYRQVVISPDMVGSVISQFIAVEAKAPDAPGVDDAQFRFINRINASGGVAIVVRERKDLDKL